ncbi:MAG: hypothetical protein ACLFWM_12285 [Actinomycetota bacterium]
MSPAESLGRVVERRDAELFSGRSAEMRRVDAFLKAGSPHRVLILHGPGGVGKSAVLREARRRAVGCGYVVRWVDGRDPHVGDAVLSHLSDTGEGVAGLLMVDTYEQVEGIDAGLRSTLQGVLDSWRVVIASRRRPAESWRSPPWDRLAAALELGPLPRDEAALLLRRRGVEADEALLDWARGEPLALTVAADAASAGGGLEPSQVGDDEGIAEMIFQRLIGNDRSTSNFDVLAAASVGHLVDASMLEAMVPDVDPPAAERWLRGVSFSEELNGRIVLHARVREAVRTLLRAEDPAHYRQLRRRLADHLHARARRGENRMISEMARLVDDPRIRWGLGVESAATHRAGGVLPGDEELVEAAVAPSQPRRWELVRRWFQRSPQHIVAVRDRDGELTGVGIYVTAEDAPAWADEDPVLGSWLDHARASNAPSLLNRVGIPLRWIPGRASVGNSVILGRWEGEVRRVYGYGYPGNGAQLGFLEAMGYRRVTHLDATDGEQAVRSYVLSLDGGVAGHVLSLVYRDLGLDPVPPVDTLEEVRRVLKCFHRPADLAASPLARGSTVAERADSVRSLLEEATAGAFGDTGDEQLLRSILETGYMASGLTHEAAARAFHLGRSTYFRRLRRATERLAAFLENRS